MIYLSKSKYVKQLQCEKLLWLDKHNPSVAKYSADAKRKFAIGNAVGELAKRLFGGYFDVTATKPDGGLDIRKMKENTAAAIARGEPIICEAAFDPEGLYCAVDILRKSEDGWEIYEVKSALHVKTNYIADIAYQRYAISRTLNITGCYLITLNSEYVRHGELDLESLFLVHDVTAQTELYLPAISQNINRARDVLGSKTEPNISYGRQCRSPYECPFLCYCQGELTEPSAYDLYGCDKNVWADKGYRTMRDIVSGGEPLTDLQSRQIEYAYNDLPMYIDKPGVRKVLSPLKYPMYFLDFETAMPEIPAFDGGSPYTLLPFMYSLHYIESEGGEVHHLEFLSTSPDPRREVAESLSAAMRSPGCVVAYNASFEKRVITLLAEMFPDLTGLSCLTENFIDLLDVFKGGFVYNRRMGGSFSLKSIVPALFDSSELDYEGVGIVRSGSEALTAYAELTSGASGERKQELIDALHAYCGLDTLALVKIIKKLIQLTQGE